MAWVERFTCDICGKLMSSSDSWWVAAQECSPTAGEAASHPTLRLMPWDNLLGHSAGNHHLCGAVCTHTFLDRWMAEFHAGVDECSSDSTAS